MRRWTIAASAALALGLVAACGSDPSTGPRPISVATATPVPTPVPLPVARDGLTHDVVEAEITPAAPGLRDTVTARAPLCLLREQRYDGGPVYLWKIEEDYVDQVAYSVRFTDGSYRMIRWATGFTITLDQGLDENDAVMRKAQEAAAEVTRRTGLPISIGPGGAVHMMIDANILVNDDALATTSRQYQGATIVGATVKFAAVANILGNNGADYTNTFLHEMGHVMGLGHSPVAHEIMSTRSTTRTTAGEYQPREALTLHMMYQHRTAGNRPPDRDAALSAASTAHPLTSKIRD